MHSAFNLIKEVNAMSDKSIVEEAVDIHEEVVEEAVSSGFGIFSTPGSGKSDDEDEEKDEGEKK
jgi:hypothetical protein